MTYQAAPLILFPFLVCGAMYAIKVGRKGTTLAHRLALIMALSALVFFALFCLTLIDLLTQVWVMDANSSMGFIYLMFGVSFVVTLVIAFVSSMIIKVRQVK